MSRLDSDNEALAREIIVPLSAPEVGDDPALPSGPGAGRVPHRRGDGTHRRAGRRDPGRGAGHGDASTRCSSSTRSAATSSTCAPTSAVSSSAARSCWNTRRETLGIAPGSTTADGLFTLEDVECIAACTEAPACQVNYRYFHQVTTDDFDELIEDLRAGAPGRRPRPRHAGSANGQRDPRRPSRRHRARPRTRSEPDWFTSRNAAVAAEGGAVVTRDPPDRQLPVGRARRAHPGRLPDVGLLRGLRRSRRRARPGAHRGARGGPRRRAARSRRRRVPRRA